MAQPMRDRRLQADSEQPPIRYTVEMKKGYRIFGTVCTVIVWLLAVLTAVMSIKTCRTADEIVFCSLMVLFFVAVGVLSILDLHRCVTVRKGSIQYRNGWKTVCYRMTDIRTHRTEWTESGGYWDGEIYHPKSYDRVTTFYSASGKKLFRFGLAYRNVDELQRDIDNCRKSLQGQKERR